MYPSRATHSVPRKRQTPTPQSIPKRNDQTQSKPSHAFHRHPVRGTDWTRKEKKKEKQSEERKEKEEGWGKKETTIKMKSGKRSRRGKDPEPLNGVSFRSTSPEDRRFDPGHTVLPRCPWAAMGGWESPLEKIGRSILASLRHWSPGGNCDFVVTEEGSWNPLGTAIEDSPASSHLSNLLPRDPSMSIVSSESGLGRQISYRCVRRVHHPKRLHRGLLTGAMLYPWILHLRYLCR